MSRSSWKGNFFDAFLLKQKYKQKEKIKIWSRNSVIGYSFVGFNVQVYNGKKFIKFKVTKEKVGFKFGEFAYTRVKPTKKIK